MSNGEDKIHIPHLASFYPSVVQNTHIREIKLSFQSLFLVDVVLKSQLYLFFLIVSVFQSLFLVDVVLKSKCFPITQVRKSSFNPCSWWMWY